MPTTTTATTLGAFLKRTRSSRAPDAASARAPRRRLAGLRREEVAAAAGISVTWYTWLEQGRPISASRATLARIATALRMDRTERKHLFDLARVTPGAMAPPLSTTAPAEVRALVDAMRAMPAYVVNGRWDVLFFNAACRAVLGAFDRRSRRTGNVLRRLFVDDDWRRGFADWDATAQSAVAQFRSATGRFQGSDDFAAFISALAEESPEFRAMWERRHLAPAPVKQKTFTHPIAGSLHFHYASMRPDGVAGDLSIVVYAPMATSREAVDVLTTVALTDD